MGQNEGVVGRGGFDRGWGARSHTEPGWCLHSGENLYVYQLYYSLGVALFWIMKLSEQVGISETIWALRRCVRRNFGAPSRTL